MQTNVNVSVDIEDLAGTLACTLTEDELLKFVLALDEVYCDLNFTKKLAKKLKKIIKRCEV